MKGAIKTLNNSGHGTTEFDTEVPASMEVASEEIRRAQNQRSAFFDGQTKEQIPSEDLPSKLGEYEEVVVLPPMAGG